MEQQTKSEWEEKRIPLEIVDSDEHPITKHRDWLLGGYHLDWEYYVDKITNELVLRRK